MKVGTGTIMLVLFAVFLTLKLTGTIAWSWWWVFAPLWLPVLVVVGLFVITLIAALIADKVGE